MRYTDIDAYGKEKYEHIRTVIASDDIAWIKKYVVIRVQEILDDEWWVTKITVTFHTR